MWQRTRSKTRSGRSERMQSDPPPAVVHRERDLGAVLELRFGGDHLGIGQVQFGDASERVAHEPAARLALDGGVEVLELAPAAFVVHIVRAAGLDPVGRGLEDPADSGAGVAAVGRGAE